jgi:hypothetical protein
MEVNIRLRRQTDLQAARRAFHRLFRNGISCGQPVVVSGSAAILWGIRHQLSEEQFEVIASADCSFALPT